MTTNETLQDNNIEHSAALQKYSNNVLRRMIALLNRVDSDLVNALLAALERMPEDSFTVARLEALLGEVRSLNASAYRIVFEELDKELTAFADYETNWQYQNMAVTVPPPIQVRFPVNAVAPAQVKAAAMARPFQGRLLREWPATVEADRMVKIRNAIRTGYVEGKTASEIVRKIKGTKASNYTDGILNRPRHDLMAVTQTAISHTANIAREETRRANEDLIKGVKWLSTLDTKTSPECVIRDKKAYTLDHKPIGHKNPWLGGPGRIHFNAVPAGSMITTKQGLKKIEDVRVGDFVLTHKGRFKPVTDTRSKPNKCGIIRALRMESGRVFFATDDHPVIVSGVGWKLTGAVEVGDTLFCNTEQSSKETGTSCVVVPDSEYGPSFSDNKSVALERAIKLAAACIDFEGNLDVGPSEIEDMMCGAVLGDPSMIKCQSRLHYLFALSELLGEYGLHRLGELLFGLMAHDVPGHPLRCPLVEAVSLSSGKNLVHDAIHAGRVILGHALRVCSMNIASFLGQAKGPVVGPAFGFSSPATEVGFGLLGSASNWIPSDLRVPGERPVCKVVSSLDSSERQSFFDVLNKNEAAMVWKGFGHDVVHSIEVSDYSSMVYDLAIQGDASYLCNGIVVSNCRSSDTMILKSWKELGFELSELDEGARASMDGQVPSDVDYPEWITRQSAARQDRVLGKKRAELLRTGKVEVEQFFNSKGQFLTIDQLIKQDSALFGSLAA